MSYILNPPTDMCIVMHWCSSSLYRRVHVKKEEITVSKAIRIAIETAQVNSRNIIDVNSPTFRALNILFSRMSHVKYETVPLPIRYKSDKSLFPITIC